MVKRCEVCKGVFEAGNEKISFHRFPLDEKLLEIWKKITGIKNSFKEAWICSRHFKSSDLRVAPGGKRRYLRKGAKPIVHDKEKMSRQQKKSDSYSVSTRITSHLSSSTETASETEREMRFPSDKDVSNLWCEALQLDRNKLRKYSYICSNHFHPENIVHLSGKTLIKKNVSPVFIVDNVLNTSLQSERDFGTEEGGMFPSDKDVSNLWCEALQLDRNKLRKYSYICSNHFHPENIVHLSGKTLIKKNVSPVFIVDNVLNTSLQSERDFGTEEGGISFVKMPKLVPISDAASVDHCFRDNHSSITIKDECSPTSRDNNSSRENETKNVEPISKMLESSTGAVDRKTFFSRSQNFQDMFQRKVRNEILTDIARERMQLQGSTDSRRSTRSLRHNSSKQNEVGLQTFSANPPVEPSRSYKSPILSNKPLAAVHDRIQVFSTNTSPMGRPPLSIAKRPLTSTENTPKPMVNPGGLVFIPSTPALVKNSSVMSPQNASKTPIVSQNAPPTLVHLPQTLPNTNSPVNSFIIIPQASGGTPNGFFLLPQNLAPQNLVLPPLTLLSSHQPQISAGAGNSLQVIDHPTVGNSLSNMSLLQQTSQIPVGASNPLQVLEHLRVENSFTNMSSHQQTSQFSVGASNTLQVIGHPRVSNSFTNMASHRQTSQFPVGASNPLQVVEHPPVSNSFTNMPPRQQTSQSSVAPSNTLRVIEHPRVGNSFTNITASSVGHVDSSITCQLSNSSTDTASETSHLIHDITSKTVEESFSKNSSEGKKSRCRTCLDPVSNQLEQASISMTCFEEKTVKEGLVQLLPEMNSTLSDDEFVCAKCFMLLRNTLRFIKKCLEAESVIAKDLKNNSEKVSVLENTFIEDGYDIEESDIYQNISLEEDIDDDDDDEEENDSEFEVDPNVEEQDYILNGITNLIRGGKGLKRKDLNRKHTDLKNAVIKHLNFLPLEHAKVRNHNSIVSIGKAEPDFIFALQQNKIKLLQNCSKFDENIFTNKRVLLLGGHTEIKCLLCEEHFNTEAKMQNHISSVHGLSKAFLMETYCYQYRPGSSNICEACGKDCGNEVSKKTHLRSCYVFPCPYCDGLFTSGQLPIHTSAVHDDPRPFKCVRCQQEKVNFMQFKSHLCSALICEICGKNYLDKNKFQSHLCNALICEICGKNYLDKKSFRAHTARCNNEEDDTRKCSECKERFDVSSFPDHIKTHKFPCSICGKIFHTRSSLGSHEYNHRLNRSGLCPLCGKVVLRLRQHMRVHDVNRIKQAKCSQCPKSFFTKASVERHIRIYHMATAIACGKCGVLCNEGNIENHYNSQHPHEKVFNCAQCEATFTRIAFLKQHAKSHASDNKSKRLKTSRLPRSNIKYLKKYNFRIKAPDAPITCKYCLKTLKGLLHYKIHLETHLKLYRYKCRYCEMTYSSPGNKNRHEKLHKDPNYKFRCNECWKIMSSQEELDSHMVCHAEKPKKYQCGECSELFCREYLLRSHLLNKHTKQGEMEKARDEIIKDAFMDFAVE